ncbi:hypothetical protein TNCV_2936101 [Trichonephila clavipes]|nr:hypothetical protein TNCV_2936101 [Trichonephila clavipes]
MCGGAPSCIKIMLERHGRACRSGIILFRNNDAYRCPVIVQMKVCFVCSEDIQGHSGPTSKRPRNCSENRCRVSKSCGSNSCTS